MAKVNHIHHTPQPKHARNSHLRVLVFHRVNDKRDDRRIESDSEQIAEDIDKFFQFTVAHHYIVVVSIEQKQTVDEKGQ